MLSGPKKSPSLGLASQPIAFNFDASNLSADLTSYKEAIKNLRRRMLHVENELRDKNTEVVALTNKIERDKKNKIDSQEDRFLRLEGLVESLTSNLKNLTHQQQKDHSTNTNSTEATAKAVTVIDKQVITIEDNMGNMRKSLGKEVSENKSNIKKNWVTISGLKPLIDTKAEKVWLDHKADKEWVAEKLETFTTTTANKSEVKKLSMGMLNNQKTVDTVKYQLEELMSQYYAQKKKNEGQFTRVQSKLGSHTQTNRALEVRIKNNDAGIEKLNEQFVDKVSGRPSDTVSFEELEKKFHTNRVKTARNADTIQSVSDQLSANNHKFEQLVKRVNGTMRQSQGKGKGGIGTSAQFEELTNAIDEIRREARGEMLERVKLLEDRHQVSLNRLNRQIIDLQESMSDMASHSEAGMVDTIAGKTRCIMCNQATNLVRGPATERYVRQRTSTTTNESKEHQTPRGQRVNRNFDLSLGSSSAALHVVKGKETHVYSKSGQVYRGREEDRVEVRTLSSSLRSEYARGSGNSGAKQRRRPASAQPRRNPRMAVGSASRTPVTKQLTRRVYVSKTAVVNRARTSAANRSQSARNRR